MHAQLFTKRLARKKPSGTQRTGIKKPLVVQRQCEELMKLAKCRTVATQRLPFPGRFGWLCRYVFRLWRCGDHPCDALIRLESTRAVQVSALVITLFHLFGHIAARFGVRSTFAVWTVHHFWLPS